MSTLIHDWKALPPGKTKYQLYLASREWAVLKEAVRRRSGGVCERCRKSPGENVHHQTYERCYREELTDLLHVCLPCHEFVSGKGDDDPALAGPPVLFGREIYSVYLAGKITGSNWRDELIPEWSVNGFTIDTDDDWHDREAYCADLLGRKIRFTGPYWVDVDGSEHGPSECERTGDHGCGATNGHGFTDREAVCWNVINSIARSDLIFGWIDSRDCYGTVAELVLAMRTCKIVVIAFSDDDLRIHDDCWLVTEMCDRERFGHVLRGPGGMGFSGALDAWRAMWEAGSQ